MEPTWEGSGACDGKARTISGITEANTALEPVSIEDKRLPAAFIQVGKIDRRKNRVV